MAAVGEFQTVRDEETGDLFLPASRRPDGTWRKPRRVKEGFIPQEEVPLYESKGRQLAKSSRPANCPVGMNPALVVPQNNQQKKKDKKPAAPVIPGLPPAQAASKKKKKKPAHSEVATPPAAPAVKKPVQEAKADAAAPAGAGSTDPAKRLKNVKKKLRDIEALEAKLKNGELKNPDKDQLEKIKRKPEVLKEMKDLEKLVK
uniref:Partner of Y14 and mago n=1 Tax=Eubosmina coregoni TaxID=186181 RepID=A0A4Y7LSB0_9CRUS|nr:EOG090X0KVN [Eubosmina coregoni]SVE70203.1 EOG090X0KVN [Eubosmina coregoni]